MITIPLATKSSSEHFDEELLNVQEDRGADIVAVGCVQVPVMGEENEREITREEVKRALNETKGGKAPGMDGVRVEMLKEGGVTALEWLVGVFNICFMLSMVPVDWVIACMVSLYKGKGDVHECSNFRGISLLSVVGKVYGRILINRIRDKTDNVIAEVQSGFRRGRECTDQIFIDRQICKKYLEKDKDMYLAFLDLEKAYDGLLLVGGNSVTCGDFNYWVDDPSSKPFSAEFVELLDRSNFENFVCFPTHLSGHTLDLILAPAGSEYVKHVEGLPFGSDMSDHALILFSLEVMRPHAVKKTITFRSYRNVDNNSIVNDIKHILNILDVSSLTAEDCTIWYNNFFNSLENKFCPLISKEILVKADAPWYDHTVAVLRRQRRRAERRWR